MHHLREQSTDVGRLVEQDQAALCALLRISRLLAEHLGVEVPRGISSNNLVAEAESLAASVASSWRRQKASGTMSQGVANLAETKQSSKVSSSQPLRPKPFSRANSPEPTHRPLSRRLHEHRDQTLSPAAVEDLGRTSYCDEGTFAHHSGDDWFASTTRSISQAGNFHPVFA